MDKVKILLIDDEQDFLEVMTSRIESWGYDVTTASNGKDGLDLLVKDKPDIIILDYMMPDMDGVKALGQIRKIDKKIPVIMFTAHPDLDSMEKSEKLEVSFYVPKLTAYSDMQTGLKSALGIVEKKIKKEEVK